MDTAIEATNRRGSGATPFLCVYVPFRTVFGSRR